VVKTNENPQGRRSSFNRNNRSKRKGDLKKGNDSDANKNQSGNASPTVS
jgi:hypothetical protein